MLHNNGVMPFEEDPTETVQSRMRKQMQAHALQPLRNEDEEERSVLAPDSSVPPEFMDHVTPELLEEATQFLRLQVRSNCSRWVFLSTYRDLTYFSCCIGGYPQKGTGPSSTRVDLPAR